MNWLSIYRYEQLILKLLGKITLSLDTFILGFSVHWIPINVGKPNAPAYMDVP